MAVSRITSFRCLNHKIQTSDKLLTLNFTELIISIVSILKNSVNKYTDIFILFLVDLIFSTQECPLIHKTRFISVCIQTYNVFESNVDFCKHSLSHSLLHVEVYSSIKETSILSKHWFGHGRHGAITPNINCQCKHKQQLRES